MPVCLTSATQTGRAVFRSIVFILKVLPILPSRPIDWITTSPVREHVSFESSTGEGTGDLYRPSKPGPHPAVVVCLGVLPFGFDHPQVPRLGAALARSGFAALLYRSPLMEKYLLEPQDIGNVTAAFQYLIDQPYIDESRSGIIGTCVGGSFALLASARPEIAHRVRFVGAFAPYGSAMDLAAQIACSTRLIGQKPEPWDVDPLTKKVFLHSLTATLETGEAAALRNFLSSESCTDPAPKISVEGKAIHMLFSASNLEEARDAVGKLPVELRARLSAISPSRSIHNIEAPVISIGHDRDDMVVPIEESRLLRKRVAARNGYRFTEFRMFQHADPIQHKLRPDRLIGELWKFIRFMYPLFRESVRR